MERSYKKGYIGSLKIGGVFHIEICTGEMKFLHVDYVNLPRRCLMSLRKETTGYFPRPRFGGYIKVLVPSETKCRRDHKKTLNGVETA